MQAAQWALIPRGSAPNVCPMPRLMLYAQPRHDQLNLQLKDVVPAMEGDHVLAL